MKISLIAIEHDMSVWNETTSVAVPPGFASFRHLFGGQWLDHDLASSPDCYADPLRRGKHVENHPNRTPDRCTMGIDTLVSVAWTYCASSGQVGSTSPVFDAMHGQIFNGAVAKPAKTSEKDAQKEKASQTCTAMQDAGRQPMPEASHEGAESPNHRNALSLTHCRPLKSAPRA